MKNKQTDEVKIIKVKKTIPTVIEWQGRKYTYRPDNLFQGGKK